MNERSAPNRPGLIPAWAGKTDTPTRLAAHVPGSSPRGRGKPTCTMHCARCIGLIPAWAGKTEIPGFSLPSCAAHPRVGGENREEISRLQTRAGSSPRGRGKPHPLPHNRGRRGLIPAWAGKTRGSRVLQGQPQAHPRVGGENFSCPRTSPSGGGSSPRGRGKHREFACSIPSGRLIPAWAGKTVEWQPRRLPGRAHPRVGGENSVRDNVMDIWGGSSPRGRGKRLQRVPAFREWGLIPAWAGKTPASVLPGDRVRAHPRVGGENLRELAIHREVRGSSPRGRGKR